MHSPKITLNRILWHIGSSIVAYCSFINFTGGYGRPAEYDVFHPYIAAWILGINLTIFAITNISNELNWF